jgi:tetratricopeptide (TPR) repeat protein
MFQRSRIWNLLPEMFVGSVAVAIVFSLPVSVFAKTPEEIYKIARSRTVLIESKESGGSGVILSRKGNIYLVLTNDHVACVRPQSSPSKARCDSNVSYTITTHDGKKHSSTVNPVFFDSQSGDPDLAVISFESSGGYAVATLGNSEQTQIGSSIYVYGFPGYYDLGKVQQEPQFSPGNITSKPNPSDGYALSYSAVTWRGMSGGPIFDGDGRVIGIHGRARMAMREVYDKNSVSSGVALVETGFNLGIPINTFISLVPKVGLNNSDFTVANASTSIEQPNLVNPQKAQEFYVRGLTLADKGDQQGAIKDFNASLELDPKIADTYFSRGVVRKNLGDHKGAIEDYTQAIRLNPKLAFAYNNRGLERANSGDFQGAIEDYDQALSLEPKLYLLYNNRGLARTDLRDFKRAIEDYDKSISLEPKFALSYYNRGLTYIQLGDLQSAIADFNSSILLSPRFSPAHTDLGAAFATRGVAKADSGDIQGAMDDLRSAVKNYDQAILISPTYPLAYYNRCDARLKLGDFKGAMGDCDQAIRLSPKFARAYNNRAIARTRLGDRQGAIEDFQKAAILFLDQKKTGEYQQALDSIKKLQSQ